MQGDPRDAWVEGPAEYERAVENVVRTYAREHAAGYYLRVTGAGVIHQLPQDQLSSFQSAVAYALWERWGPIDEPLACPTELIAGYARDEQEMVDEFREVAGDQAMACAEVIGPSRLFHHQLLDLAPTDDPGQPERVRWFVKELGREIHEEHARYGIATGLAFRWLEAMRAQGITRGDRYLPTYPADAVLGWAREPFWVDVVKVGVAPADDTIAPGGVVLRSGSERDHDISWIRPDGNAAHQQMVVRNQVKRLSGKRTITELRSPPTPHVWALSQLGFTAAQLSGNLSIPLSYGMSAQDIHDALVRGGVAS